MPSQSLSLREFERRLSVRGVDAEPASDEDFDASVLSDDDASELLRIVGGDAPVPEYMHQSRRRSHAERVGLAELLEAVPPEGRPDE